MNALLEYAPLAALLSPVFVIAGLNAWLALKGEEGTLLMPSRRPLPALTLPPMVRKAPAMEPELEDQVVVEPEYREAA